MTEAALPPILVADDDPAAARLLTRQLEAAGIPNPVIVVADGVEAIDYLAGTGRWARDPHPDPLVLMLDLVMPNRGGFEVLEWLGTQPAHRGMPVIVLSALRDADDVARSYELGATAYLVKPSSPDRLAELIGGIRPLRILIVDDNPDDRLLETRLLRGAFPRAEIVEVADARTWAANLAEGRFDLVITDYNLSWSNGLAIFRQVHATWPARPVIMVTGTGSEEIATEAMKLGLQDYVLKHRGRVERLPVAVRGALERAAGRALDRVARAELEREIEDRARMTASIARIEALDTPEATAELVCAELRATLGLGIVALEWLTGDTLVILGMESAGPAPLGPGSIIPRERSQYLRERATRGPWIEEWDAADLDDPYFHAWRDAGFNVGAFAPLVRGGEVRGLLVGATASRTSVEEASRRLPALVEYAALATALIEPIMRQRTEAIGLASDVRAIIAAKAFRTVFQPIVGLASKVVAGYEALTRFEDGVSPAAHFANARRAGVGVELELATLAGAMEASRALPPWAFLSLNVSAELLAAAGDLGLVDATHGRPLVLELTEHEEGVDTGHVLALVAGLGHGIKLAVDDAGAGYAGLQRVLELRPDFVKLDIGLVRNIDRDPAREALIAGMVHFARETDSSLIAEGIEREGERRILRRLGVSFGQGYLLGRPGPAEAWTLTAGPDSGSDPVG